MTTRQLVSTFAASLLVVSIQVPPTWGVPVDITSFDFQTAARNGESPATSGVSGLPAGTELYVRERGNTANPELEVRSFLKFDLSTLSADKVHGAWIELHQYNRLNTSNGNEPLYAARVDSAWDPTSPKPTFTQPVVGGSDFQFGTNGGTGAPAPVTDIDHVINVSGFAQDWQTTPAVNHGVRLRIDDNFVAAAFDHTGADAPVLRVAQVTSPYVGAVAANGPTHYYRLDEAAGTVAQNVGTLGPTADGTYTNTPTLGQAGPRPSDFAGFEATNDAVAFAGTGSEQVTIPLGTLPTGSAPRTIEGWFDGTSGTQNFLSYGQDATGKRVSVTANSNEVAVAVNGQNFGVTGLNLPGDWHHVAVVFPTGATLSNQWRYYVDGVDRTAEATNLSATSPVAVNTGNIFARIGLNSGGTIDEVAVYGADLSSSDVFGHFATAIGMTNVESASGQITPIAQPPSIAVNALQSNDTVYFFQEQKSITLAGPVDVDITLPGTYGDDPSNAGTPIGIDGSLGGPATIPAGTILRSYYVHYDTIASGPINGGTITFDAPILGIIFETPDLQSSDFLSGLGSTQGPILVPTAGNADLVALSSDLRSVTFDFLNGGANVDQIRILVAVPEPATWIMIMMASVAACGLPRRRNR